MLGAKVASRIAELRDSQGSAPRKETDFSSWCHRYSRRCLRMRYTKCWIVLVAGLFTVGPVASAKNASEARAEQDRLQNAGKAMQVILNVPDDIPQDLIDKVCCVVVMPSVLEAALVVGGSYGRGTLLCRTGT